MPKHDNRRVITIVHPDGTETRRVATVCRPDRRRPDWANRLHTGDIQGPECLRCAVHHDGSCND